MKAQYLFNLASKVSCVQIQLLPIFIFLAIYHSHANAIDTRNYFPLDIGSTWTARGTMAIPPGQGEPPPPYTMTKTMVPGKIVDGRQTTKEEWFSDDDSTDRVAPLFTRDFTGIKIAAWDQMEPSPMSPECLPVVSSPYFFLPSQVQVGQTFLNEMTLSCDGITLKESAVITVIGFSKVAVPAGKFRVLTIKRDVTKNATWQGQSLPPSKGTITLSLARGVGLVKSVEENFGSGAPFERWTETEVLLSTNRKYDERDNEDDDCCDIESAGGSINYADGNLSFSEIDTNVSWSSPLTFVRTYNSGDSNESSGFGIGWSHNYSSRLEFVMDNSSTGGGDEVRVVRPSGRRITFNRVGNEWRGNAGEVTTLTTTKDSMGLVTAAVFTDSDGRTEVYDSFGQLKSITYRQGATLNLNYENGAAGRLLDVTDNYARSLHFSYDDRNRIKTVSYGQGIASNYIYDEKSRLTSVVHADGKSRKYNYEEVDDIADPNNVSEDGNLAYAITSIDDENGARHARWTYDTTGRLQSSELAGGVNRIVLAYYGGNERIVTDGQNRSRNYVFQRIQGKTRIMSLSAPCDNCQGGIFASRTYDANGNVTSAIDFNGITTTFFYDLTRNLETKRIEAYGTANSRTVTTQWHSSFRLPLQVAEPKRLTTYAYSINGLLTRKTVQATNDETGASGLSATLLETPRSWNYTYNSAGQVLTVTGPRADGMENTTFNYDTRTGNLETVKDALGRVTRYSNYDVAGRVGQIIAANGVTTDLTYTSRGWLASEKISAGSNVLLTSYEYDGVGQIIKVTFPDTTILTYAYDNAHRLTGITDGSGNNVLYELDSLGNRLSEIISDPAGVLTRKVKRTYDDLNRLNSVTGSLQ